MDYLPPSPSLFHGGGARQSALFGRSTLAAASSTLPATEWCVRPTDGLSRDTPFEPSQGGPASVSSPVQQPADLPLPGQQHNRAGRHVIDLFCGSASSVQFHLGADPSARALVVDMLSETELKDFIPSHLHDRITFYGDTNVQDIRFRDVRQMVHDAWDIPVSSVDAVHASPRCTMMSRAPRGRGPVHFVGTTPVSAEAIRDMRALKQTLHLMRSLREYAPACMLSVENPAKGRFELLPCVLQMQRHGFQLREADHCMMAGDVDSYIFTQKPTVYLLGNV